MYGGCLLCPPYPLDQKVTRSHQRRPTGRREARFIKSVTSNTLFHKKDVWICGHRHFAGNVLYIKLLMTRNNSRLIEKDVIITHSHSRSRFVLEDSKRFSTHEASRLLSKVRLTKQRRRKRWLESKCLWRLTRKRITGDSPKPAQSEITWLALIVKPL